MGRSFSRKARNSAGPWDEPSVEVAWAAGASAAVGSVASYAASSEARSDGRAGALGAVGSTSFFTEPTCASLACHTDTKQPHETAISAFLLEFRVKIGSYSRCGLVCLDFAEVEVLDDVCGCTRNECQRRVTIRCWRNLPLRATEEVENARAEDALRAYKSV